MKNKTKYVVSIIIQYIKCGFHRDAQYRMSYLLELVSNVVFILTNIVFWESIFMLDYGLPMWSREQMYIFLAYVELFFAIKGGLYTYSSRFANWILSGKIDTYLVQPISVNLCLGLRNIKIFELLKGFLLFLLLLFPGRNLVSFFGTVIGVFCCFLGAAILNKMQLIISYSSFWIGRSEALYELVDALMNFNKYPINIMPQIVKSIFIYIFPFYAFSTNPTLIALYLKNTSPNAILLIIYEVVFFLFWRTLERVVWRVGVKYYESYNS